METEKLIAKKILLVDDDKTSNFICSKILTRMGVVKELFTAQNGREALNQIAQKIAPEVILIDLNMPVMDGFQFIEAFLKLDDTQKGNARIAILTSSEAPEDVQRAKLLGIEDYFVKPIKDTDIIRMFQ